MIMEIVFRHFLCFDLHFPKVIGPKYSLIEQSNVRVVPISETGLVILLNIKKNPYHNCCTCAVESFKMSAIVYIIIHSVVISTICVHSKTSLRRRTQPGQLVSMALWECGVIGL